MKFYEDGEYRASKDWPHAICAGCVVYREVEGEVEVLLLFHEGPETDNNPEFTGRNTYHLPKGHMHLSETIAQAALREAREETGCSAELEGYLGIRHWSYLHPKTKFQTEKVTHYYAAKLVSEDADIDNEHDGKTWVPINQALTLLGAPNKKQEDEIVQRLKEFLEVSDDI